MDHQLGLLRSLADLQGQGRGASRSEAFRGGERLAHGLGRHRRKAELPMGGHLHLQPQEESDAGLARQSPGAFDDLFQLDDAQPFRGIRQTLDVEPTDDFLGRDVPTLDELHQVEGVGCGKRRFHGRK